MNLLLAFDKFKDSMSAAEACNAAEVAAYEVFGSSVSVFKAPLTDGGEGFCSILTEAASGLLEHHTVCGPLGDDVRAPIGWVNVSDCPSIACRGDLLRTGRLAIIEMASAAGLEQVPKDMRHPSRCTTRGVGELIRIAASENASAILLGIGGSATSDLGLGALEALGIEFPNAPQITPRAWNAVSEISGTIDVHVPPIFIACDVDNPLVGAEGAAAIYGPQKGLLEDEIEEFDREANRLADLLCQYFNQGVRLKHEPSSGAAGGIGFGLKVACAAEFVPGFELVRDWLALDSKVARSDLILTGEGKFDRSSLAGKGPCELIKAAEGAGTPSILLAGKVDPAAVSEIAKQFPRTAAYSITPETYSLDEALANGAQNLTATAIAALKEFSNR